MVAPLNRAPAGADNAAMPRALAARVAAAPSLAHATAGFAERHSDLAYNSVAAVHWIHPGDGCDCGSTCFQLVPREDRFGRFKGLECSLDKISVPETRDQTLVMAQCCADGAWVVYDLASQQVLARMQDPREALLIWMAHGLPSPKFADAQHGAHGLHQTWGSRFEDWAYLALMWLPLLLVLCLVVGLVKFVIELKRYMATRRVIHLMWCGVLLLPALSIVWFVARVVLGAGRLPGH